MNLPRVQHNLTCSRAVPSAEDASARSSLFQQLQSLTDLLLEGYVAQLESTMQAEGEDSLVYADLEQKYTQERAALISPFCEWNSPLVTLSTKRFSHG